MNKRRRGRGDAMRNRDHGFHGNGTAPFVPPRGQRQAMAMGFQGGQQGQPFQHPAAFPGPMRPASQFHQFHNPASAGSVPPHALPPPPARPPGPRPDWGRPANMPWSQTAPLPGHLRPGPPIQFLPPGRPQATPLPLIQPGAPIVVPPGAFRPVQGPVLLQGPPAQLNGAPLSPQAARIGRPAGAIAAAPPSDPPMSLANGESSVGRKEDSQTIISPSGKPEAQNKSAEPDSDDAGEQAEKIKQAWAVHKTDDGKEYYFNSVTNESSWSKPEGFSGEFVEARPTSQLRVPDTSWFEVHCEDGRKYFFNEQTQETSWAEPEDVIALKQRVKEAKITPPVLAPIPKVPESKKPSKDVRRPKRGREIEAIIPGITQPPLPLDVPPPMPPPERTRPLQLLNTEFFDLLTEKGVTPFSLWERELPKLIGDARYQAIVNMKDRRALFEEFCKKNTADKKRQKVEPQPALLERDGSVDESEVTQDAFKALLQETLQDLGEEGKLPIVNAFSDTYYEAVEGHLGSEPRWQACAEKHRRSLLTQHLDTARRKAEEAKQKREKEPRSDMKTLTANFKALLVSFKIHGSSRWSKSKDSLARDDRYKALPRDLREKTFRDFVADQRKLEEEREKDRLEKEKKDRAVQDRMKRDAEEAENRQKRAAQSDAVANFTTLLNEMVKDVGARWPEWWPKLQRDPQGRATNPALSSKTAEQRFRDHVLLLQKKAHAAFVDVLNQNVRPLLPKDEAVDLPAELRSFTKAEKLWQDDTRAVRVGSRDREDLYRKYVKEIIMERDEPDKLLQKGRLFKPQTHAPANASRPSRYGEDGPDQAYERAYLAHDRKRLKKS